MTTGPAIVAALWALNSTAVAQGGERSLTLLLGTPVELATRSPLSSKTSAKGDMVALRTTADVSTGGIVVIPAGTDATGQVEESRGTGGMGTNGRLVIRPLYLRLGDQIVRLTGAMANTGRTKADTVIGMALLTPLISGRSAVMPAGTAVNAIVEKTVELSIMR